MLEKNVEALLAQLTLEEKVALCHANSKFSSNGVERLGIGELTMSDGPHGVRPEVERDSWKSLDRPEDACTYLPTGTALAATWNPELAERYGRVLGAEARYRGKDIILGPGVNLIRSPLCGRNFEYMSEDPRLIAGMAAPLVRGIQSQDVAACVKHYCLNNQELDRHGVNVEVSTRALQELYLPGFYGAIMEGGAWSVMGAYNRYENRYLCHNKTLVKDILKGRWGFDGVYLTDWGGAHDTREAVENGLDIEMGTTKPYNEYYLADAFLALAREEPLARQHLDRKVRRILRLMLRVKKGRADRKPGAFNTPEHQKTAYDVAAEAMVLLKNRDGLLPLDPDGVKRILVVGPNADQKHAAGGSSSGIKALYELTPLEGIRDRVGSHCQVDYHSGDLALTYRSVPVQLLDIADPVAGTRGYRLEKRLCREDGSSYWEVSYQQTPGITLGEAQEYRMEFSFDAPQTGTYGFRAFATGNARIFFNDVEHMKMQANGRRQEVTCAFSYRRGEKVRVRIRLERVKETVEFRLDWLTPQDWENASTEAALMEQARQADWVIYCGGLDHSYDTEAFDKKSMQLPSEQDVLIPRLLEANPNTVVVLTAGSPVTMPWLSRAPAVLWTWYGGMETGHVLWDILTGRICPSGKLPFTLPKAYEDTPVARYGEYQKANCRYLEDIFVGYRGFERDGIEPLFPFGHGLSYSRFLYSALEPEAAEDGGIRVRFRVTNIGGVAGKETAQVYLSQPKCAVERPPKELRAFQKVALQPGETRQLTLTLTPRDLAYYEEASGFWRVEPGEFVVSVGSSSGDIRLKTAVTVEKGGMFL